MSDSSKRMANPSDLEHLAKLFDGRGNLKDKLDEAFTRASRLGVQDKLAALKPLRSWTGETATDLRRRAAILRAEKGDPKAAALYAGFRPEELNGLALPPDAMLIANASIASGDKFDAAWLKREPGETYQDWLQRIPGDAVAKVSGNEDFGEVVGDYIEITALASTVPGAFKMATLGTLSLIKRFKHGDFLKAPGTTLAQILKGRPPSLLPARIARLGAQIGRSTPPVVLDVLTGSDRLAQLHGGRLHAWEANLLKVGNNVGNSSRAAGASRLGALRSGTGAALRTAGWWRAAGIGGSAVATGVGAFDLIQEGNPADAFKRDKLGYVSKVSGAAFNASLTAAMVAPNPVTIGAAVVTGAVYGGVTLWQNREKIKEFPGKIADAGAWAGKKAAEGAGKLADGAKKLGSALNPFD
ncbi:mucin-2 [Streptomyces edwardsiae]|uniref:Mucin-2 n=1 Tax=Streptomyces edwardsiae TaxID=3075527 RepID=A0ABU2QEZ6_9ACTN|nr:mucin-2 [Streptomyces sp. DSM 41635]MDT0402513.1 mucin-2 [Streptomyces sp. DSM 41635]